MQNDAKLLFDARASNHESYGIGECLSNHEGPFEHFVRLLGQKWAWPPVESIFPVVLHPLLPYLRSACLRRSAKTQFHLPGPVDPLIVIKPDQEIPKPAVLVHVDETRLHNDGDVAEEAGLQIIFDTLEMRECLPVDGWHEQDQVA